MTVGVGRKRGPKPAKNEPLDLSALPEWGHQSGEAPRVIAFAEQFCRVPKGSIGAQAGSPVHLRPWQREVIHGLYPFFRPRQGLVSISRKNGKSYLGACLALYHLLADNEDSAEVLVVSSDERTAKVVFNLARRMVELSPELSATVNIYKESLGVPSTDSVMEVLAGDASRSQGRNPSLALVDECHVTDPDSWDALALGQATRARPLTLGISTECGPDEPENLMARLVEHGREGSDPQFFFREYTAPVGCDLHDRAAWAAANPMLGDTLDPEHLAALVKTTRESRFRRYHLNQRVSDEGAWLPTGAWEARRHPGGLTRPPDGAEVVLALDGSYSGDATALLVCTVPAPGEAPHLDLVGFWEPPVDDVEYRVEVADVEQAIRDACVRWRVREACADPHRWTRSLQTLQAESLPMAEFPQSAARMTPATTSLYEAIMNGAVTHSGNSDLSRHVVNAHVKDDARGVRLQKRTKWSKYRIDAAVTAVMAHARATFYAANRRRSRVAAF